MTEPAAPPSDAETVAALRRVKAAEAEWGERLRAAREGAAGAERRAHDEAEATLKAVVAEATAERARHLEEGRAALAHEIEAVRLEGERAAEAVRREKGKRPADRADEVLRTVLGPYSHD